MIAFLKTREVWQMSYKTRRKIVCLTVGICSFILLMCFSILLSEELLRPDSRKYETTIAILFFNLLFAASISGLVLTMMSCHWLSKTQEVLRILDPATPPEEVQKLCEQFLLCSDRIIILLPKMMKEEWSRIMSKILSQKIMLTEDGGIPAQPC